VEGRLRVSVFTQPRGKQIDPRLEAAIHNAYLNKRSCKKSKHTLQATHRPSLDHRIKPSSTKCTKHNTNDNRRSSISSASASSSFQISITANAVANAWIHMAGEPPRQALESNTIFSTNNVSLAFLHRLLRSVCTGAGKRSVVGESTKVAPRDLDSSFARIGEVERERISSSSSVRGPGDGMSEGLMSVNFRASGGRPERSTEGEDEDPRLGREEETSRFFVTRV
jgi:hypothetical protein